jgi:hypothetical protein
MRKALDPYTRDRRDPLEIMARLLVGSSYRVPVAGRGTRSVLGTSDVAGAVGYMRDGLEKQAALAVATRADPRQIAALSRAAYRQVVRAVKSMRPRALDLTKGDDRWRLRLVVFDAAHDLVHPEAKRPWAVLAKEAKMRRSTYTEVHKAASSILQGALNAGRSDFADKLFRG